MDIILYCNNEGFHNKNGYESWVLGSASLPTDERDENESRHEEKQHRVKEKVSLENFIKNFWLLLNILQALRKNTKEAPQTMAARKIVKKDSPLTVMKQEKFETSRALANLAKLKINSVGRCVTNRRYFWCEKKENREI